LRMRCSSQESAKAGHQDWPHPGCPVTCRLVFRH
jgi:hypothetical protein